MSLAPGTRLGVYEITAPIGAGGMGEVYRARDAKLGRDVALKILPQAFASDQERLARFRREAQILASLNHPNIATIHGLEDAGEVHAIVMELVDGPTLADWIARGPIPLSEALPIARQITDALEAAHEQGVVHRDLKPANVKVKNDGTVKVLDFGLAKAVEPARASGDLSNSPTVTSPAVTRQGVILGTAAYMSPEQARGKPVDKRADIWAFACVFYEMLTTRRLFGRENVTDTLAAIVKEEPDLSNVPQHVVKALQRCLDKDPRHRLRDVADIWYLIDEPTRVVEASSRPGRRWRALQIAGLVVFGIVLGIIGQRVANRTDTVAPTISRVVDSLPESRTMPQSVILGSALAIAPDGRTIVYRARENAVNRLYARSLDRLEATPIGDPDAEEPFFSPDSQWIGFRTGAMLKRVPVRGGPSETIATLSPVPTVVMAFRGASWTRDGVIFLGGGTTGLHRVSETGGTVTTVLKPGEGRLAWYPQVLPGGRALLYTERALGPPVSDQLLVHDLVTGQSMAITAGLGGQYLDTGHLVFMRAGSLWAVGFDLDRLSMKGAATPVLDGVRPPEDGLFAAAQAVVSAGGTLAYLSPVSQQRSLVWVDRQGREQLVGSPPRAYANPRVSPDGKLIAVPMRDEGRDVWIWDVARSHLRQLTSNPEPNFRAEWFRDSKRLAFSSSGQGNQRTFWQAADGSGSPQPWTTRTGFPQGVLADGSVLYSVGGDVALISSDGREERWRLRAAGVERNPIASPDGRWLAYESDRTGRFEIYVRKLPDRAPSPQDGEWPVTSDGGLAPVWSRDSRELFYWKEQGATVSLSAVPIVPGPTFVFGQARELFRGAYARPSWDTQYDAAPDGRFVMMKPVGPQRDELVFVFNWTEELKRLVPTN